MHERAHCSSSEQKVALLYDASEVTVLGAKLICTANDYDFAGTALVWASDAANPALSDVSDAVFTIRKHGK